MQAEIKTFGDSSQHTTHTHTHTHMHAHTSPPPPTHTHTHRTYADVHAHTHARTHAHTHAWERERCCEYLFTCISFPLQGSVPEYLYTNRGPWCATVFQWKGNRCVNVINKMLTSISASDCGLEGLGFKSHQSCWIFQPWPAPAQSWECYGPMGKASLTSQMHLWECCSNYLTNTADATDAMLTWWLQSWCSFLHPCMRQFWAKPGTPESPHRKIGGGT